MLSPLSFVLKNLIVFFDLSLHFCSSSIISSKFCCLSDCIFDLHYQKVTNYYLQWYPGFRFPDSGYRVKLVSPTSKSPEIKAVWISSVRISSVRISSVWILSVRILSVRISNHQVLNASISRLFAPGY